MIKGLDVAKMEAAFKRAAYKAVHGTREERSGRFFIASVARVERSEIQGRVSVFSSLLNARAGLLPVAHNESGRNADSVVAPALTKKERGGNDDRRHGG
jgi:hypothetical protein